MAPADRLSIRIHRSKGEYYIAFIIQSGKYSAFYISNDSKVYIKTTDNAVTELVIPAGKVSSIDPSLKGSYNIALCPIQLDVLQKLSTHNISVIRIETSKGDFDYDIAEKDAKDIAQLCKIIQ